MPEYKTQSLKKSRLILSHYGMFKGCWDWLILVATIYIAVAVPYNASFVKNFERVTMPSDVVVEALFIVGERMEWNELECTPSIHLALQHKVDRKHLCSHRHPSTNQDSSTVKI